MYGRERALELRERYPHASEIMALYVALTRVWESAPPRAPLEWAGKNLLPRVMSATVTSGPPPLAEAMRTAEPGDGPGLLAAWLADEELTPVERYLARATMRVVPLEPGKGGAAGRCPECGGPPQVSFRQASDDPLVSARRMLACAKCPHEWNFSATTCPACGESAKRTVHAEPAAGPARVGRKAPGEASVFPHLRAESCESCHRYLIDVDLGRDPRAVPQVDELAAVPIDLHLADQGYTKITPNLMGF
ncbi:FdhE protein [Nonomuraea solani]|uniref:FdhE protein n=1 Tax=Nonomuraea solani TaxID=1144553 RepID=A0A1H5V5A7_9ACTN|nr:formate dehydrogenase accessory protein FdhE [Nonomuraea solani]SEF82602.1 FdhE protein [Nonomuraea solani]